MDLIGYNKLSPEKLHDMKVDTQRKVLRKLDEEKAMKGKAEEIAKKLKDEGIAIEIIVKSTGLSKEEIEKL